MYCGHLRMKHCSFWCGLNNIGLMSIWYDINNSLIILHSIIQIFSIILSYTYNYSVPGIVAQSLVTITISIFSWPNSAGNEDTLSLGTAYARKQSMCCSTLSHWPTCRWNWPARSLAYCLDTSFTYSADSAL